MMSKKLSLLFLLIFYVGIVTSHAQAFTSKDIQQLLGEWKGSLTYLDYTSKKEHALPADLKVRQLPNSRQLVFTNTYPNEPKANNADTISFTKNGRMIGQEVVKSKTLLANSHTKIVTEYDDVDGNENKPALIRHTYVFGRLTFLIRKEVLFKGDTELVKRHEYSFTRK